jgi:hypothetical protein
MIPKSMKSIQPTSARAPARQCAARFSAVLAGWDFDLYAVLALAKRTGEAGDDVAVEGAVCAAAGVLGGGGHKASIHAEADSVSRDATWAASRSECFDVAGMAKPNDEVSFQ